MAYVQSAQDSDDAGPNRVDIVLTGVVSGNYIVAFAGHESDASGCTFSTQAGSTNAWTEVQDGVNGGDFHAYAAAYTDATATGDVTVRIEYGSTGAYVGGIVAEYDNISSYDSTQYNRDTTNDPASTTAATPGGYDAICIGWGLEWAGGLAAPTADTGWTQRLQGADYPDQTGDPIAVLIDRTYSSGDVNASFDVAAGTNTNHLIHLVFIETGGGDGPTIFNLMTTGIGI